MSAPSHSIDATSAMQAGARDASASRIRRRNRMITSCLECRRRKLKCDKQTPCTNCTRFSRDCLFLAPALDSVSQKRLNELKDKMGSLERVLENDIVRTSKARSKSTGTKTGSVATGNLPGEASDSDLDGGAPEDEKNLEETSLVAFDAAYEGTANDDALDVGVRVGLFRLYERVGGGYRPQFAEEMAQQVGAPICKDLNDPTVAKLPDHDDFLSPGPDYIAPGAGFMHGDVGLHRALVDFLPAKLAADELVAKYYRKCHFMARAVHWPSFQMQYADFWDKVLNGVEPPIALQAIIMAVLFSAVVSMPENEIYDLFLQPKRTVLNNFQTATEVALSKANWLRTTKVDIVQALVIYLIPMIRDPISRAHSVLVGAVIRLAECIGLHRDPSENFGMSPVEAHVRRMLWYQICFLDFTSAERQGPRPWIRRDEYDTRFPRNVNDADLSAGIDNESDGIWTDMTFSRMRFECCEMWRVMRTDIQRLHNKDITITHAIGKIESFRKAMEAKYVPILDMGLAQHRFARLVLSVSLLKMHIQVLSRFQNVVHNNMPDRLRQILLTHGTQALDDALAMYTKPEFEDWSWYNNAMWQWATALLLTSEVLYFPQRREADRIWKAIDFVFKPDQSLTRDQKARSILSAIRDRAAFYRSIRGFRAPVSIKDRLAALSISGGSPHNDEPERVVSPQRSLGEPEAGPRKVETAAAAPQPFHGISDAADSNDATDWTFDSPMNMYRKVGEMIPQPGQQNQTQDTGAQQQKPTEPSPPAIRSHMPEASSLSQAWEGNTGPPAQNRIASATGSSPNNWSSSQSLNGNGAWRYAFSSPAPAQSLTPPQTITPSESTTATASTSFPSANIAQLSSLYMRENGQDRPGPLVQATYPFSRDLPGLEAPNPINVSGDVTMGEIDWSEWDKMFPPETNTGNLDQPQ